LGQKLGINAESPYAKKDSEEEKTDADPAYSTVLSLSMKGSTGIIWFVRGGGSC